MTSQTMFAQGVFDCLKISIKEAFKEQPIEGELVQTVTNEVHLIAYLERRLRSYVHKGASYNVSSVIEYKRGIYSL